MTVRTARTITEQTKGFNIMKYRNAFWTLAVLAAGAVGYFALFHGFVDKTMKAIGDSFNPTKGEDDYKDD